jgi:hypothetical protein
MDAPTISAFAAAGATIAAGSLAAIQFVVGRKQAEAALVSARATLKNAQSTGRHTVAESRQNWINKVIDTLCEHHAITMTRHAGTELRADDDRLICASRTKLGILLNPDETEAIALMKSIDDVASSQTAVEREAKSAEMLGIARRLLKREWVRIKEELR